MKFNEDSQLIKTWVRLVKNGTYERSQVPKIGNLKEVVYSVLDKEGE